MTDTPTLKPISKRMEKFCQEFLVDLNRSRAAERAGFSPRSAYQLGYKMMKDPRILARIAELMREREESTRVKAFMILEEVAAVALSSIDHFEIDAKGFVTARADAPPRAMGAVERIRRRAKVLETTKTVDGQETTVAELVEYDTEITLVDKNPQITNALKHLGLLKDVVEHRDLTLEDIIREAAEKETDAGIETK